LQQAIDENLYYLCACPHDEVVWSPLHLGKRAFIRFNARLERDGRSDRDFELICPLLKPGGK